VTVRSIYSGLALVSLCAACAHHDPNAGGGADARVDGTPIPPDAFAGPWSDFPGSPIIDPGGTAPTDSGTLFGDPTMGAATGGPCLFEPEVGTIYPRNWIHPLDVTLRAVEAFWNTGEFGGAGLTWGEP